MSLEAAAQALDAGKKDAALEALLTAWRRLRHPRIASVIDRVSDELADARGPIEGKTLAKQVEALAALHEKKDSADLGRILRQRWPGTWQKALPLLEQLLAWDEDPRLERTFSSLIADPPWESQASWGFFHRLIPKLRALTDPRVVPLLEAAQGRRQQYWYGREFRPVVQASLSRLQAAAPALDDAAEDALERLEAHYAESASRERDKARGEKELLADIYENPGDLQARAVFADWLSERNDARGELITLQLTQERTRAQDARINALLKAHGAKWAGPLDEFFDEDSRQFDAGFLVGGRLVEREPRPFGEAVKEPAWRLVRTIELTYWTDPAHLLRLPRLETLHGLNEQRFVPLAKGPPTAVRELSLYLYSRSPLLEELGDAELPGLPALETLGIAANEQTLEWARRSPLFKRLKRLRLGADTALTQFIELVRDKLPNITELELLGRNVRSWFEPEGWRVTMHRTGPGPFTRVTGSWNPARYSRYSLVSSLGDRLAPIDAKHVTSLSLSAARTLLFKAEERKQVDQFLARFAHASIEAPWDREETPKPKQEKSGPALMLSLSGETLLQPDMSKLWGMLGALGLTFDSYSVGYGSAHRSLGKKPAETMSKWGKNERCSSLSLYEDGGADELTLTRDRRYREAHLRLGFAWNGRSAPDFLDWLTVLLDSWRFHSGVCHLAGQNGHTNLIGDYGGPGAGWLSIFGETHLRFVPAKELRALAAEHSGLFVRETKRCLVLGTAEKPAAKDAAQLARLGERVRDVVVRNFARVHGFDFEQAATAALAGPAGKLGFAPGAPNLERGGVSVVFSKGNVTLEAKLFNLLGEPRMSVDARRPTGEGHSWWSLDLANDDFDPKTAGRVLATAAARLEADTAEWLADPAGFSRRNRRRR